MRKCPPGVFCIENVSMFFVVVCVAVLGYIWYVLQKRGSVAESDAGAGSASTSFFWMPSWPYTNLPSDPLLNPYAPPLRDERYITGWGLSNGSVALSNVPWMASTRPVGVPINVSTNIGAVDTAYRQVGILTASNSKGRVIPLMGRPLFTNRNKWQYYTNSDQLNSMRLPLSRNGKSCTNEYGCDQLSNGDTVYIEGLNEAYSVTLYDNDTIKYLPFI